MHGGTILALMNVLMKEQDNYYKWSVGNGRRIPAPDRRKEMAGRKI